MEDFWGKILAACIQGACTIVAVSIAARFAINKFHREKKWEKTEAAYTDLFKALQSMADELGALATKFSGVQISAESMTKYRDAGLAGRLSVEAFTQLGAWRLSEETIKVLKELMDEVVPIRNAWKCVGTDRLTEKIPGCEKERQAYLRALRTVRAYAVHELSSTSYDSIS